MKLTPYKTVLEMILLKKKPKKKNHPDYQLSNSLGVLFTIS